MHLGHIHDYTDSPDNIRYNNYVREQNPSQVPNIGVQLNANWWAR